MVLNSPDITQENCSFESFVAMEGKSILFGNASKRKVIEASGEGGRTLQGCGSRYIVISIGIKTSGTAISSPYTKSLTS